MQHFFHHQVAVKLCLSSAQSTAPTQMKNILPALREEKLPPQTRRCKSGKLSCAHWTYLPQDLPRHSRKLNLAQNSGKKGAFSICFSERIKLANFSSIREAKPAAFTTDSSGRVPRPGLPGCLPAPRQGARRGGEHPLPLCPYPGIRVCSQLLPGNSSLRNTTVLASEQTKDTISVARG